MFERILVGGLAGLLLASCADEAPAPDVATFRQLNEQLVAAADTHETNASAISDMADCISERDRYAAEVRPIVTRMRAMSAGMDDCMMAMGRDSMADMQTTCGGMSDELTAHIEAACASSDLAQDRAETERHCSAMRQMAEQEIGRADTMMQSGGMGSGMMSGGTCHE